MRIGVCVISCAVINPVLFCKGTDADADGEDAETGAAGAGVLPAFASTGGWIAGRFITGLDGVGAIEVGALPDAADAVNDTGIAPDAAGADRAGGAAILAVSTGVVIATDAVGVGVAAGGAGGTAAVAGFAG